MVLFARLPNFTLGYDLSYIALIPSPTGKIRFAANRPIRFGEAYSMMTTPEM
ncbi:hypothetical protein [Edaphobacter modestus]|uniref:Uncharacterized protein n=1 Tax=Edaphobacter modestus TaxID=388466 RepID=A0A4Q7YEB8_9BACT|nr:hypothetical protein [Edaphobacter modestus]RZU35712.1 hypothetical protein BDD14_5805 [Edaphobacter modestus]